ncbi:MAG TPA: hypothetical protein VFS94_03925 [Gemmatimonadales bacterium]|nr:hypothetical protein [Gemmatimonadales bacterium]
MRSIDWQTCWRVARAGAITLLLIGCDSVEPEPPEEPVLGLMP